MPLKPRTHLHCVGAQGGMEILGLLLMEVILAGGAWLSALGFAFSAAGKGPSVPIT